MDGRVNGRGRRKACRGQQEGLQGVVGGLQEAEERPAGGCRRACRGHQEGLQGVAGGLQEEVERPSHLDTSRNINKLSNNTILSYQLHSQDYLSCF